MQQNRFIITFWQRDYINPKSTKVSVEEMSLKTREEIDTWTSLLKEDETIEKAVLLDRTNNKTTKIK